MTTDTKASFESILQEHALRRNVLKTPGYKPIIEVFLKMKEAGDTMDVSPIQSFEFNRSMNAYILFLCKLFDVGSCLGEKDLRRIFTEILLDK